MAEPINSKMLQFGHTKINSFIVMHCLSAADSPVIRKQTKLRKNWPKVVLKHKKYLGQNIVVNYNKNSFQSFEKKNLLLRNSLAHRFFGILKYFLRFCAEQKCQWIYLVSFRFLFRIEFSCTSLVACEKLQRLRPSI